MFNICLVVFPASWDGGRFNHPDDVGERFFPSIMRCRRSKHQCIALLREKLCQVAPLAIDICNGMTFIDDNDIPV